MLACWSYLETGCIRTIDLAKVATSVFTLQSFLLASAKVPANHRGLTMKSHHKP